jgi:endonuclease-3
MKAKNLLATAQIVADRHNNEVPRTMRDLVKLPGIARKTANCVLFGGFGINAGLAVDTHVKRIAYRLGLTDKSDPDQVEQDLMRVFPQESWGTVNNKMVLFGREICVARKPKCAACPLAKPCPKRFTL